MKKLSDEMPFSFSYKSSKAPLLRIYVHDVDVSKTED